MNELVVLQEIVYDWDECEIADPTFADQLKEYYGNLMDDLHDSKGDSEYQADLLDRMRVVEGWLSGFPYIRPFTDEEKAAEQ
jgi:hypothetical protein